LKSTPVVVVWKVALDELCRQSSAAISVGFGIIILSDRGATTEQAPIPALLAVAGVHHHLIRQGTRTQVGFVIESGEPREVHHFALLLGYGAAAIQSVYGFRDFARHDCPRVFAWFLMLSTLRYLSRDYQLHQGDQ